MSSWSRIANVVVFTVTVAAVIAVVLEEVVAVVLQLSLVAVTSSRRVIMFT